MNKIKITFRCDGATLAEIGTGHVRRNIAIAEMLVKKKICLQKEISFVTRRSGFFRLGYDLINKAGYTIEKIDDRYLNWNSKSEATALSKIQTDILIFDRLSTTYDFMSSLKIKFKTLVTFDDIGTGTQIADVVINGIFHNLAPKKNRYIGYKYLFLKDTIFSKKKINKNVKNIAVSFGGYDKRNITKFFLNCLLHKKCVFNKKLNIQLIVGKENIKVINLWKKLIKRIELRQKIKINLASFPPNYFKKLMKADFAIVSGGLTVFDCICRGIPVIGLPQYQHQLKTLTNLKNKNVIKLGSKEMSLNKKNFINSFNRMMSSYKDRNLLSKNSLNLIDKKGSERVINILRSLF